MSEKKQIKFGTDGWRGVISDNFTFENVRKVAGAIAQYYDGKEQEQKPIKIVVGYDTRFLSHKYAEIVAQVLADNGAEVLLSDRYLPTPALSFAVKHRKFTAGVMITASHNPADYNGIKIKTCSGGAAGVEVTQEVERLIDEPRELQKPKGKVTKTDLTRDYINFLRHFIDFGLLKNAKFKVLVDPMHGSGDSFIAQILKGSGIKLAFLRNDVNPSFEGLRPEPVLENLQVTLEHLKNNRFDAGLVLDGDADRIAAFAGKGEFINPQKILALLILHLVQDRKMSGAVVKTIVGSNMIDNVCSAFGIKLHETAVGFKYISELMVTQDILVGGEEAGGIGFKGYIPERDGTLAGLLLLEMMAFRKKTLLNILEQVEEKFGRYYYLRDEVRAAGKGLDISRLKEVKEINSRPVGKIKDFDGIKFILNDESWLMLRASGTEPIIRVYAESKSIKISKALIEQGKKMVAQYAL